MSLFQQNPYKVREKEASRRPVEDEPGAVSRHNNSILSLQSLEQLLQHLFRGLARLFTALRFRWHRFSGGQLGSLRLPWFKLALAGTAFFIISQKNVQFSFNLKAPLSVLSDEEGTQRSEQMGVAQPIAYHEEQQLAASNLEAEKAASYIRRFAKVAQAERKKYGIPASVKMAMALLESQAGDKPAKRGDNNHFGQPMAGKAYESAWANWRAHSIFIARNYPSLFQEGDSPEAWAHALQASGYTDRETYAKQLMSIIERFQLRQLD